MRVGVIHNPRSRRNLGRPSAVVSPDVIHVAPESPEALGGALNDMAAAGIGLLIVDGGDGTVREVLSQALSAFGAAMPPLAVIPHGKTNALAHDLGVPPRWSIEEAMASAMDPGRRQVRPVVEVRRARETERPLIGFAFGAGAYVEATRMATQVHRVGLMDDVAVGFALLGAAVGALLGRGIAKGQPIRLNDEDTARLRFLVFASTLERLPLGLRPFGPTRAGLKLLDIDAPARRLFAALPEILAGREPGWLEPAGYRRRTTDRISLFGLKDFVLDGEIYAGGDVEVRRGPDVVFVTV
ncbi:MAG: acylglycerol kinase family protein [Alphaproteobacteria bacterium]|nr:acylglycerol kinase family protein [Alphaproteobacteria bacterium]MBU2380407.1 acylglycerol kinase family protein [Alphaproteobacteria bacterium]